MSVLARHLDLSHQAVPARRRREIKAGFGDLPVIRTWQEVQPRPDHSLPLNYLKDPVLGFPCPYCTTFKTTSRDCLRHHRLASHPEHRGDPDSASPTCSLQSWTNRRTYQVYWIVDIPPPSTIEKPLPNPPLSSWSSADDIANMLAAEAEEEHRLLEAQEGAPALPQELEQDENTDWLRGCEWPRWFAQRPLALIVAASQRPSPYGDHDLMLGTWRGHDCISPAAEERTLRRLIHATGLVFARCEETLQDTPRVLRCWLRSWSSAYLPYPFAMVQREASKLRYYSYSQRFLCYIYRIWLLAARVHAQTVEITGLQLNIDQQAMLQAVWDGFACLPDDFESQDDGRAIERSSEDQTLLLENLFQLMVMFWTDLSMDGTMSRNAIVHYSGVLGIHPYELAFRGAYEYTPYLSALIWVGRFLLLEYCLPRRGYRRLACPWPDRSYYPDQLQRLHSIRHKYLLRGSLSPLGYLIERLRHGRATAKHDGPRTNISWSPDGQCLHLGDHKITMSQFRSTIQATIHRVCRLTDELLFGWQPSIDLTHFRDDLVTRRPGYSFLAHPANDLQDSFRVLSRKAFSPEGGFHLRQKHGREKALQHIRSCDQLTRLLYGAIHVDSGMPARCEELRFLRWANTISVRRNVFLYHGQLILVFTYNKASTNHNNTFYVVRTPCRQLQQKLFIYLAYLRPFRDFLARQLRLVAPGAPTNPHIFSTTQDTSSCFSSSICLSSLRQSTPESPFTLNFALYRQIAVSIAKKHLPSLTRTFNPHIPCDENGLIRLLSWQAGHTPATHNRHYALEREFPAQLQPQLIDRYLENSRIWHEFTQTCEDGIFSQSQQDRTLALNYGPAKQHLEELGTPQAPKSKTWGWEQDQEDDNQNIEDGIVELGRNSSEEYRQSSSPSSQPSRKRRRQVTIVLSPMSKKIAQIQQELAGLIQERNQRGQNQNKRLKVENLSRYKLAVD
jgi:hypothetical protein